MQVTPIWLKDNHVSDREFLLILLKLGRFNQTKLMINDETEQSLIKQSKQQAVEQFKNMFGKWKT
jgi:hypothetical protein